MTSATTKLWFAHVKVNRGSVQKGSETCAFPMHLVLSRKNMQQKPKVRNERERETEGGVELERKEGRKK